MKKEILDIIKHFILGLIIGLIISGLMVWSYNVGKRHSTQTTITDTIVNNDTITNWQSDTVYFNHYDTINTTDVVIINDTVNDTTYIQLPIYTYIYDTTITDSTYRTSLRAVVSGFDVTMDSLYLSTEIMPQKVKKQPWYGNIVPACGIGFGTGGQIGLFVGIGYKIF